MGVLLIDRTVHSINGKVVGTLLSFESGKKLYLSLQSGLKPKSLDLKSNSWCIDVSAIRWATDRECCAIGIAHKVGKKTEIYITNIQDMNGEHSKSRYWKNTFQRSLPKDKFLVNTTHKTISIAKAMCIR
jgi:hypothetical protein